MAYTLLCHGILISYHDIMILWTAILILCNGIFIDENYSQIIDLSHYEILLIKGIENRWLIDEHQLEISPHTNSFSLTFNVFKLIARFTNDLKNKHKHNRN